MLRVVLADDSAVSTRLLERALSAAGDIEIVGTAVDGQEALEMVQRLRPDVLCTDLFMPRVDGLALTRAVMGSCPVPILVITGALDAVGAFPLLQAGALDIVAKPRDSDAEGFASIVRKIRRLAGVFVFKRKPQPPAPLHPRDLPEGDARVVGIGASTGGPQALLSVLSALPSDFPAPILCVQHITPGFLEGLVTWLGRQSKLRVRIAERGDDIVPGTVYFAPDGMHLCARSHAAIELTSAAPLGGHRPSVTVMLRSLARVYGDAAVGVLLSGMGRDGVDGLRDILERGGSTIAQDRDSSVVYGMPGAAVEEGVAGRVLAANAIGPALVRLTARGRSRR